MRYKILGNSGLRVSELCLGTMTFGEDWGWGSDKETSLLILNTFLEAGGNFIDTANLYTNGTSERFLGEFLEGRRDSVVLATKYTNAAPGGDPNLGGNSRKNLMQSLEASLRRLQTDYIDLYWVHAWDHMTPLHETMRALDDAVCAGKVRYIGISDAPAWVVSRANTMADLRGWSVFIGLQIEYSLAERSSDRELLPMARALDIGVTAWSPLAGGLLTGKYTRGGMDGETKRLAEINSGRLNERNLSIARVVDQVASEEGISPAQVALNWCRAKQTIPIIGARSVGQLQDNLACLNTSLGDEPLSRLDAASTVELGFPHDFLSSKGVRNYMFAGNYDKIDFHRE